MRPLRGRALIRLHPSELVADYQTASGLWVSTEKPREKKIHRGRIVALGPPSHVGSESGAELPWDCEVGDEVLFAYAVWLERMRRWEDLAVVAQAEIVAVLT